jgi:hypothetical protein
MLTHLWPGTSPAAVLAAADRQYNGPTSIAEMYHNLLAGQRFW